MLKREWTVYIVLLAELLVITMACPSNSCAIINSTKTSLAMQVINLLQNRSEIIDSSKNDSFTFYIQPGTYNATNGTQTNFFNFSNITFQKYPNSSGEVSIQCPNFTDVGDHNGLGFVNCSNISIFELTFTKCGQKTFGSYFENINNLDIVNSTFHHNLNNGVGIHSGKNIRIINCTFESSVGLQNDFTKFLIQQANNIYGGAGLGIVLLDITNTSVTVKNCTFRDNVALKSISQNETDSRPYNYIPFGNGGGVYINLNNVKNVTIKITNCHFYNNTALHQGGGIVTFMIASSGNVVEVADCEFIENKAIGYPLLSQLNRSIDSTSDIDKFIAEINSNFTEKNFTVSIRDALLHVTSETISKIGGIGGALSVNIFRDCEYNTMRIKRSNFVRNLAIGATGIGFFMRDGLSNISNGVNTNRAWISRSQFSGNYALLGGSAIGVLSRTRIDIGNLPTVIDNCQFDKNIVVDDNSRSNLFRFGVNGVITTIRTPLTFLGVNQFDSNIGGCININNAKVDINGTMNFTNNMGTPLGGAIRIVGLSLLQLFPSINMMFSNNSAEILGGAIGVDNVRVEDDLALIQNYNCFLQYNIGREDESCPSNWKATTSFANNTASEGSTFYVKDISRCTSTPCYSGKSNATVYASSLFNISNVFNFSNSNVTSNFVTAPSKLLVDKKSETVSVFPGEEFILSLRVLDQNNNEKVGFYAYPSNAFFIAVDVIEIDLTTDNKDTSFAVVKGSSNQRTSLVIRNAGRKFSSSYLNNNSMVMKKEFTLNFIDSSTGTTIREVNVIAKIRSCHFLYSYNSRRGNCQFIRNHNKIILRSDNISTYFYIQSEMYGELENGVLRTGKVPPFYQSCNREGGLAGCLVKYDDPYQQCSKERSGFLCGRCPLNGSDDVEQGLAFNLLECVSCEAADRILFVLICILIVVLSIIIMFYNVGLSNSLRGFLFYSQMIGYVYVSGARRGLLDWDFFLSRVFGFSFYFPICLTHMNALQVASFGFLPPVLILMAVISYTILARRLTPLSNKKTLDGIWFLIIIVYVYTFDTCFNLLRCTTSVVHSNDFSKTKFHSLVYFYDGSVTCYQDEHIIYAVISILVLLTFVIPFPFIVVAISYNYFKRTGPFCDVINTDIKPKHKWWSGYDLFRRLLFITIYFVIDQSSSGDYTQLALTLCAIFILLMTSRIHPYNKRIVNLVECLILLDLVVIAAYFLNTNQSVTGSNFGKFLFILPYIYMLIYVVIKFIRRTKLFKMFKRRVDISHSFLQSVEETDATEKIHLSYIEYREELLEFVN